ncbi:hypothetical protein THAOC_07473 [Thalassiosira oceanica]|uniref:Uncharacterized protein n=1 Tax=Thalassiosira oceanica TaxID=159749 RepID=K0SXG5_THAOC|nr:hypothetical protein THAOC_07473 [Thalassiosira oceanica]|eukprot:EJK71118.1 hypothetical protein THAOC_07473 [Thalassiosira oceanica]
MTASVQTVENTNSRLLSARRGRRVASAVLVPRPSAASTSTRWVPRRGVAFRRRRTTSFGAGAFGDAERRVAVRAAVDAACAAASSRAVLILDRRAPERAGGQGTRRWRRGPSASPSADGTKKKDVGLSRRWQEGRARPHGGPTASRPGGGRPLALVAAPPMSVGNFGQRRGPTQTSPT